MKWKWWYLHLGYHCSHSCNHSCSHSCKRCNPGRRTCSRKCHRIDSWIGCSNHQLQRRCWSRRRCIHPNSSTTDKSPTVVLPRRVSPDDPIQFSDQLNTNTNAGLVDSLVSRFRSTCASAASINRQFIKTTHQ